MERRSLGVSKAPKADKVAELFLQMANSGNETVVVNGKVELDAKVTGIKNIDNLNKKLKETKDASGEAVEALESIDKVQRNLHIKSNGQNKTGKSSELDYLRSEEKIIARINRLVKNIKDDIKKTGGIFNVDIATNGTENQKNKITEIAKFINAGKAKGYSLDGITDKSIVEAIAKARENFLLNPNNGSRGSFEKFTEKALKELVEGLKFLEEIEPKITKELESISGHYQSMAQISEESARRVTEANKQIETAISNVGKKEKSVNTTKEKSITKTEFNEKKDQFNNAYWDLDTSSTEKEIKEFMKLYIEMENMVKNPNFKKEVDKELVENMKEISTLINSKAASDKLYGKLYNEVKNEYKVSSNVEDIKKETEEVKELTQAEKKLVEVKKEKAQVERTVSSGTDEQVRSLEDVNAELEKEKQNLKQIEALDKKNDNAIEKLQAKRDNYSREVFGNNKATYDIDKIEKASNELKSFNAELDKRNQFEEKYQKILQIISQSYVGKYSISNGVYKDLDDFVSSNPTMKQLENLHKNGIKGVPTKDINALFKSIVHELKSEGSTVSRLISSGEVNSDHIIVKLAEEEKKLLEERQSLYDTREKQLSKINDLQREQLDLMMKTGKASKEPVESPVSSGNEKKEIEELTEAQKLNNKTLEERKEILKEMKQAASEWNRIDTTYSEVSGGWLDSPQADKMEELEKKFNKYKVKVKYADGTEGIFDKAYGTDDYNWASANEQFREQIDLRKKIVDIAFEEVEAQQQLNNVINDEPKTDGKIGITVQEFQQQINELRKGVSDEDWGKMYDPLRESIDKGNISLDEAIEKIKEYKATLNNETNISKPSFTEEPSGQLAMFEGVEEKQKEVEQSVRKTNDVIDGQIDLFQYLASSSDKVQDEVKETTSAFENLAKVIKELSEYDNKSLTRIEQGLLLNSKNGAITDILNGKSVLDGKASISLRSLIDENVGKGFDTSIHSHPNHNAVFSEADLRVAFNRVKEGFIKTMIVSFDQVASLNVGAINENDKDAIISSYKEAKKQIGQSFAQEIMNYGNMKTILSEYGNGGKEFSEEFGKSLGDVKGKYKDIINKLKISIENYLYSTIDQFDKNDRVSYKDLKSKLLENIYGEIDNLGFSASDSKQLKEKYINPAFDNAFKTFNTNLSSKNWNIYLRDKFPEVSKQISEMSNNMLKKILTNYGYEADKIFSVQSVSDYTKSLTPDTSNKKAKTKTKSSVADIDKERQALTELANYINDVLIKAIDAKTEAFEKEKVAVNGYVQEEIADLERLRQQIQEIVNTLNLLKEPIELNISVPKNLTFINDLKDSLENVKNELVTLISSINKDGDVEKLIVDINTTPVVDIPTWKAAIEKALSGLVVDVNTAPTSGDNSDKGGSKKRSSESKTKEPSYDDVDEEKEIHLSLEQIRQEEAKILKALNLTTDKYKVSVQENGKVIIKTSNALKKGTEEILGTYKDTKDAIDNFNNRVDSVSITGGADNSNATYKAATKNLIKLDELKNKLANSNMKQDDYEDLVGQTGKIVQLEEELNEIKTKGEILTKNEITDQEMKVKLLENEVKARIEANKIATQLTASSYEDAKKDYGLKLDKLLEDLKNAKFNTTELTKKANDLKTTLQSVSDKAGMSKVIAGFKTLGYEFGLLKSQNKGVDLTEDLVDDKIKRQKSELEQVLSIKRDIIQLEKSKNLDVGKINYLKDQLKQHQQNLATLTKEVNAYAEQEVNGRKVLDIEKHRNKLLEDTEKIRRKIGELEASSGNESSKTSKSDEVKNLTDIENAYNELAKIQERLEELKAKKGDDKKENILTSSEAKELDKLIEDEKYYNTIIEQRIGLRKEEQGLDANEKDDIVLTEKEIEAQKSYNQEIEKTKVLLDKIQDDQDKVRSVLNSSPDIANVNAQLAAIKAGKKDIAELKPVIESVENEIRDLNIKFAETGDIKAYQKEVDKLINPLKNVFAVIKTGNIEDAENAIREYLIELDRLNGKGVEIKSTFNSANNTWKITGQWVDKTTDSVKTLGHTWDVTTGQITTGTQKSKKYVSELGKITQWLGEKWKNVAGYFISFGSVYEVINIFRQGINVVREFDTALTEMRKVSDETVASLKDFQKVSFDIAEGVGSTALQIQNSTADFMRLGNL